MQNLQRRITKLMKEKHMSQAKLAELAKVSPTTISNLLKNKKSPNYETLKLVSEALEVDIRELFTEEPINRVLEENCRQRLLKAIDKAKPEEIEALIAVAKSMNL